jgi:hypothetical protein
MLRKIWSGNGTLTAFKFDKKDFEGDKTNNFFRVMVGCLLHLPNQVMSLMIFEASVCTLNKPYHNDLEDVD